MLEFERFEFNLISFEILFRVTTIMLICQAILFSVARFEDAWSRFINTNLLLRVAWNIVSYQASSEIPHLVIIFLFVTNSSFVR